MANTMTGGGEYQPGPTYKKPNKKKKAAAPALKGNFKPGGSYNSGRAIVGAPGTKVRVSRGGAAREGMGSKSGGRASTPGGFGATASRKSAAGRGKGGEMMGSNKSSSAQAGKFAPKKKAPLKGSKY